VLVDATGEAGLTKEIGFDAVAFVRHRLYLPLVLHGSRFKQWSGMHLGNRNSGDWTAEMLAPFDPSQGGIWPHIVVVQSRQVYSFTRDSNCRIAEIGVKNWNIQNYLSRAAREGGIRVIVRITPSPGNFEESILTNEPLLESDILTRTLISAVDVRPGNWLQCDNDWRFRTVDDIGDEMIAIQRYNLWAAPPGYDWSVWGFEPANEPNIEWYRAGIITGTRPGLDSIASWLAMDSYFANLYDYVHTEAGLLPIRVLTPPMAQSAFAETHNVNTGTPDCDPFPFSGYHQMELTFDSDDPKNDGYSWHNYWIWLREDWATCPDGQHVSMWFPATMRQNIQSGARSGTISEADLASPWQKMGNPLANKDLLPQSTANSLQTFIYQEALAEHIAIWLVNDDTDPDLDLKRAREHGWHQAYTPTLGFRPWFTNWWYESEIP
jgi:hypothetical protein